MTKIITIASEKGGVAKTTTAQALAQGLEKKGYRTLVIDLDSQNASITSVYGAKSGARTSYEVLREEARLEDAIQHTEQGDIVPGSPKMDRIDSELNRAGRECHLKNAIANYTKNPYDFIIIDTPPHLGVAVDNALTCSDGVIIPTQADIMGIWALEQFVKTLDSVRRYTNPGLRVLGILITRYNSRTALSKEVIKTLEARADNLGTRVFKARIRECVAIREDQGTRANLFDRTARYNSVKDYGGLIDEVLGIFKKEI